MDFEAAKLAKKQLEARRQKAVFEANRREQEIFDKLPYARELNDDLLNTCSQLSEAVFSSKNDNEKKANINRIMEKNLQKQHELSELLLKNGYSSDYLDVKFTCKNCEDTGYVMGVRCDCFKKLITSVSVQSFNREGGLSLDHRFEDFSLGFYGGASAKTGIESDRETMKSIFENCREYANCFSQNSKSILMLGGTGLGKTHLSIAIANEVLKKGFSVLYASAPDLFRKLQNEYYGRGEAGADTMDTLQKSDLVILDDLGAEIENQFSVSALYNIVNTRLNSKRPTIINTNLTLKEIEKRYSDRVASRLMTVYRCLKFVGKDIRQLKLKALV